MWVLVGKMLGELKKNISVIFIGECEENWKGKMANILKV